MCVCSSDAYGVGLGVCDVADPAMRGTLLVRGQTYESDLQSCTCEFGKFEAHADRPHLQERGGAKTGNFHLQEKLTC